MSNSSSHAQRCDIWYHLRWYFSVGAYCGLLGDGIDKGLSAWLDSLRYMHIHIVHTVAKKTWYSGNWMKYLWYNYHRGIYFSSLLKREFVRIIQYCGFQNYVCVRWCFSEIVWWLKRKTSSSFWARNQNFTRRVQSWDSPPVYCSCFV